VLGTALAGLRVQLELSRRPSGGGGVVTAMPLGDASGGMSSPFALRSGSHLTEPLMHPRPTVLSRATCGVDRARRAGVYPMSAGTGPRLAGR
jgi:hypothetical protein